MSATPAEIRASIMTTEEVADMLRRSKWTVIYWRRAGDGPPYWRSGQRIFYDRDAVLDWLAEQQRASARSGRR